MMGTAGCELHIPRIDLATTQDFDIGDLRVRPARLQVWNGMGSYCELEPRVMQVLVALASARTEVVSRDRLIETCWNGRIVGDDALNRCIVALRHLARGIDPQPFAIATVRRVGYYLVEGRRGEGENSIPDGAASAPNRLRHPAFAALLAGVIALALLGLAVAGRAGRPAP